MEILIKLGLYCLLLYGIASFVPGVTAENIWPTIVIAGVVFYIINTLIKPVVKILTFPITLLTLGIFGIVINAMMFWLLGFIVTGFDVVGIQAIFIGGIIASLGAWVISAIFDDE